MAKPKKQYVLTNVSPILDKIIFSNVESAKTALFKEEDENNFLPEEYYMELDEDLKETYLNEEYDKKKPIELSNIKNQVTKNLKQELENLKIEAEKEINTLKEEHNLQIVKKIKDLEKKNDELLAIEKELGTIKKEVQELSQKKKEKEEFMKSEMVQYVELFNDSLFDEAFILLERNVKALGDDVIAKNKHIRDFFGFIFEDEFFNELLENNRLLAVSNSFVGNLMTKDFLQDMGKKLGNFVHPDMVSIMFSFLLLNDEFDKAKYLIPFFQANIATFPKTVNEIVSKKKINSLRFICENMTNIHYNEGSLLRLASDMQPQALKMLIEEFGFDINEQSKETSDSLITALVKDKNIKNFNYIVENYNNRVNWNVTTKRAKQSISLFDLIEMSGMPIELFSTLLNDLTLKSNYVERIAKSLFDNDKIISEATETDIYDKLFSHPAFDPQVFNLGQRYFIYGLIAKLGKSSAQQGNETAKVYLKILEAYLNNHPDDNVPEAPEYHVVGAATWIASECKTSLSLDAAGLVIRRFPRYVNKPNPNGKLPINQDGVDKDSPLYRLLVNQGAIPLEPEPGFWGGLVNAWKGNKNGSNQELLAKAQAESTAPENTPLTSLRAQMREDFREMKNLLSNELCDGTIKLKCENMFLNADRLAAMMDKHKIQNAYEDFHFLSQNFSTYLKKSLTSYVDICQATADFAQEDKKMGKLEMAKNQCLENIELLNKQLALMSNQLFEDVEQASSRNLKVQNRFLKEKLGNNGLTLDDINGMEEKNKVSSPEASLNKVENRVVSIEKRTFDLDDIDTVKPNLPVNVDIFKNDDNTEIDTHPQELSSNERIANAAELLEQTIGGNTPVKSKLKI